MDNNTKTKLVDAVKNAGKALGDAKKAEAAASEADKAKATEAVKAAQADLDAAKAAKKAADDQAKQATKKKTAAKTTPIANAPGQTDVGGEPKAKTTKMAFRITSKVDGFRRAGIQHPKEPTEYSAEAFSDAQLKMIDDEPNLILEALE